jgi:hypothetical protein
LDQGKAFFFNFQISTGLDNSGIIKKPPGPTRQPPGPNHGPTTSGPCRPLQIVAAATLLTPTTLWPPPRAAIRGAPPTSSPFLSTSFAHASPLLLLTPCRLPHPDPLSIASSSHPLHDYRLLELHPAPEHLHKPSSSSPNNTSGPSPPLLPTRRVPPQTACSSLSSAESTTSRAPRRRVRPPRTASCRPPPRMRPPTAVPLRPITPHCRSCSFGEDLPVPSPQMGAPRCRATLAPLLHRPRYRQAGARQATASAAVGQVPSPISTEMGHQPEWLGQAEIGRPVSARLHSATCHFSIRLKIY